MQSGSLFVCGVSQSGSTTVSLFLMRTLLAPDDMVAELIAKRHANGWDIYDYEIGGVYHVSPWASYCHGSLQMRIGVELYKLAPTLGLEVLSPTNLGRLGGDAPAYVVPDVIVVRPGDYGLALLDVVVAVEVLSPNEDEDKKVADYARVKELTGLQLDELWHVDGFNEQVRVHDARLRLVERSAAFGLSVDALAKLFGLRRAG